MLPIVQIRFRAARNVKNISCRKYRRRLRSDFTFLMAISLQFVKIKFLRFLDIERVKYCYSYSTLKYIQEEQVEYTTTIQQFWTKFLVYEVSQKCDKTGTNPLLTQWKSE